MTLTKEQLAELEEATKPLWRFMDKYCHPHCKVIIDFYDVEIVEGIACGKNVGNSPD